MQQESKQERKGYLLDGGDVVKLALGLLGVESLSNDEAAMADALEYGWFRPRGWHVIRQKVDKEGGKPDREGKGPRFNIYAQRLLLIYILLLLLINCAKKY